MRFKIGWFADKNSLKQQDNPNSSDSSRAYLDEGVLSDGFRCLRLALRGAQKSEVCGIMIIHSLNVSATFCIIITEQHHRKVLLGSFHLNSHTLGFHPQTQ